MDPRGRWLLVRSGAYRLAAPLAQVGGLVETAQAPLSEDEPAGETPAVGLLQRLRSGEDAAEGVVIRVRGAGEMAPVRVAAAEEVLEQQEMLSLPCLLRRALGEDSPVIGAILWQGRPVPVVDLARVAR